MDPKDFRHCMGRFATGVTVVTSEADNRTHGFTVNSFTSVSLDPMLILVSVDRSTTALDVLKDNRFIVNVLKEDQKETALHFAGKTQDPLPFTWEEGKRGCRIKDALAHIECEPWAAYDGGDHVLYLGEVKDFQYQSGNPLLYFCGSFSHVAAT
ncbi:NADH-FMN oxidoreductase RutF, flavin reductase (DIM6/NTAB) family [Alteribacillus persepolensis]|uniref:NADH-FMN oxidoreductase RutF, flavin reductase (DIM6/NTAB) family n=1 Tax=Alteribacillus persepolensis TaxID=568899 RepID=A0A1G8A4J2_9BACI|nr:flavin reductase family protein [Alteribacillus persepolensis]SDH15330.1 NADH-FMN oxidoreductase RutF, flavin reductase (DIM6/NTAB) family [Alteribacillus persepolensis]